MRRFTLSRLTCNGMYKKYPLMGKDQPAQETIQNQGQTEAAIPEASDVDLNHVRRLMYTLVTVCVFHASVLLWPDAQILPADGAL